MKAKQILLCATLFLPFLSFGQGNNWKLDGNNNVTTTNYIGAANKADLIFKTDNIPRFIIDKNGYIEAKNDMRVRGKLMVGDSTLTLNDNTPTQNFLTGAEILSANGRMAFGRQSFLTNPAATFWLGIGGSWHSYKVQISQQTFQGQSSNPAVLGFTNNSTTHTNVHGFTIGLETTGLDATINQKEMAHINFKTNTLPRMQIEDNGHVKIGDYNTFTTNPFDLLTIHSNVSDEVYLRISNPHPGASGSNYSGLAIGYRTLSHTPFGNGTQAEFQQFYSDNIMFRIGDDATLLNKVVIQPNGCVGINVLHEFTNPAEYVMDIFGIMQNSSTGKLLRSTTELGTKSIWKMDFKNTSSNQTFEVGKFWAQKLNAINPCDFHVQASNGDLVFNSNANINNMPNEAAFHERMRIMGTTTNTNPNPWTRVSISANPLIPIDGSTIIGQNTIPASLLHIGFRVPTGFGGFRNWMQQNTNAPSGYGLYASSFSDNIFLGLTQVGNTQDEYDAIFSWGDNSNQGLKPSCLRFMFNSSPTVGLHSSNNYGLETARMISDGNHSRMGIGDFFTLGTDPKRQMDIYDDGIDTINGRPQLRLSQTLFPNLTDGTFTDMQTTGANNSYAPSNMGIGGHLLINPRDKGGSRTVAINFENGSTPIFGGLSLDINGQMNIRTVNQDLTNLLTQVLVRDPNNEGRVMWRDASTIGGGGSIFDLDWEHIPTLGIFSGHPNTGGYNQSSVYIGIGSALVTLLDRPVKFGVYADQGSVGANGEFSLIAGGFRNMMVHQNVGTDSRAFGITTEALGNGCTIDISKNFGINARADNAFINYAGYFKANAIGPCSQMNYGIWSACPQAIGNQTNYAGFFAGNLAYTGTFGYASDFKLKENIQPLQHSLTSIIQLNPVSYDFRTAQYPTMALATGNQFGLIAQEVETIFPDIVKNNTFPAQFDDNGNLISDTINYKSIDYTKLIPHMIQAIKELSNKNDSLLQIINSVQTQLAQCCTQPQNKLAQTDVNATIQISTDPSVSKKTELYQNRPNPFNAKTTFEYTLGEGGNVELIIEDGYGRLITTLINQTQTSGDYSIDWNAENITSGIYFYSLKVNGIVLVKKAIKL